MSEAAIKEAMDAAKVFLSDTANRRAYINRQMAIMDRQSQLENAHETGLTEGLTKGKTDAALEMLKDGLSPEKIAQYTGLSLQTIEDIAKKNKLI